jgi:hypothetical protein
MVSLKQVCFVLSFLILLVKVAIAFKLPVLADEAYYLAWGLHPQGGYYDLPPFVGWITSLGPMLGIPFEALRIFPILFHFVLAGLAGWVAGPLAYLILLTHPFLIGFVSLSPDWPLVLFLSIATGLTLKTQRLTPLLALCIGALVGLSFLSKYFAVLFFLPLLVRFYRQPKMLILVGLGAFPAFLQHLLWNQEHCMENFAFNLITRQAVSDGSFVQTFGFFLIYLLVWATPVGLFACWKSRESWTWTGGQIASFGLIPIGVFAITAIFKGQGIHWYIAFFPWMLAALAFVLGDRFPLRAYLSQSLSFCCLVLLLLFTTDTWLPRVLSLRHQNDVAFANARAEIALSLATQEFDAVVTDNYSYASILSLALWEAGKEAPVGVIGVGNRFGRAFDEWIPWAMLEGKNFLFVGRGLPDASGFSKYFESVDSEELHQVGDAEVAWLSARGFHSKLYLSSVGAEILSKFYPQIPFERACPMRSGWSL